MHFVHTLPVRRPSILVADQPTCAYPVTGVLASASQQYRVAVDDEVELLENHSTHPVPTLKRFDFGAALNNEIDAAHAAMDEKDRLLDTYAMPRSIASGEPETAERIAAWIQSTHIPHGERIAFLIRRGDWNGK